MHIKIVSQKTSNIPKRPWVFLSASSAVECAIAAVPSPASLEKTPREAPTKAVFAICPTTPPVTADGLKAPLIIILKQKGRKSRFLNITKRQTKTYISDIVGVNFSQIFPIDLIPPLRDKKVKKAKTVPIIKFTLLSASNDETKEFTCVKLPLEKTAKIKDKENKTLKNLSFRGRAFLI